MTDDERKVLLETAIAVGSILEGLADGCGIQDYARLRRIFAERAGDAIVRLAKSSTQTVGDEHGARGYAMCAAARRSTTPTSTMTSKSTGRPACICSATGP